MMVKNISEILVIGKQLSFPKRVFEEVKQMEIYKEYFKTKTEIAALQDKLERLSGEIVAEIKDLSAPMRTDFGMFTTVVTKKYRFSDIVTSMEKRAAEMLKFKKSELFTPIENEQKKEIESGVAIVEESMGLRFTPNKD